MNSDDFDNEAFDPEDNDSDFESYPLDDWKDMAFFGAMSEEIAEEESERLRIQKEFEKDTEAEPFDTDESGKESFQQKEGRTFNSKCDLRYSQTYIDKTNVLHLPYYLGRYDVEPFETLLTELDDLQKILENPCKALNSLCETFYHKYITSKHQSNSTIHLVTAILNDISENNPTLDPTISVKIAFDDGQPGFYFDWLFKSKHYIENFK